jgi:RHS repeat-associated protein
MGNQADPTTGLDDFNAREYDPNVGTFISPDPISGNQLFPQTLDAYTYGQDNPFGNPDVTGMATEDQVDGQQLIPVGTGHAGPPTSFDGSSLVPVPPAVYGDQYYLVYGLSYEGQDRHAIAVLLGSAYVDGAASGPGFAGGVAKGAEQRASTLGRLLRWSDDPAVRSAAARQLRAAGETSQALRVLRWGGRVTVVLAAASNVEQYGWVNGGIRTGIEGGAGIVGGGVGGLACGTETVATAGLGSAACPVLVAGGSALFSYASEQVMNALNLFEDSTQ